MTTRNDELAQWLSRAIQDERYWGDRVAGYYKHQSQRDAVKSKYEIAKTMREAIEAEIVELNRPKAQ